MKIFIFLATCLSCCGEWDLIKFTCIYRMLGVKMDELGSESTDEKLYIYEKGCSPSLQNIEGIMTFLLDEIFNCGY